MPEIAGNETAQSANCPQDAIFHHHADCHHQCAIRVVHRIISLIGMLTSCPARGETADWNADRSRPRAPSCIHVYMCTFSTLLAQHFTSYISHFTLLWCDTKAQTMQRCMTGC